MSPFIQEIISAPNLPYTILLGVVILYWITVILGAMDLDAFDFDLDLDADVDVDVDLDVDAEVDTDIEGGGSGGGGGGFLHMLSFFNLGKIPFMLFLSFLFISMWAIGVYANHLFGQGISWFSLAFFVPNVVLSLFVTKVVSHPLKSVFNRLDQQATTRKDLVGKICKITSMVKPGKKGQGIIQFEGDEFLFTVISESTEIIPKGAQALIVEYNPETELFLVTPFQITI